MNLIIKITATIAFILTSFILNAQESKNSLLWKIEGENIKTSYIFGTLHMMPKDNFKMPSKVTEAINSSNLMALELDMDNPNFQTEFLKYAKLPEGKELKNYMDEDEYAFLDSYFKGKMGAGIEQFKNYNPLTLTSISMMFHLGKQFASFEFEFMKIANNNNIEIKGLETIQDQMEAINSKSYKTQIDELIAMLKDDSMLTMFDEMLVLYQSENYEELFDFLNEYFKNDDKAIDALLYNRNKNWIGKIEEFSKGNNVFYGVGAGHLGGEKGVITLLKQKGYKVTPILN